MSLPTNDSTPIVSAKYIKSSHGNDLLMDDKSNLYYMHHSRTDQNGVTTTYWRCQQTHICKAMAVVQGSRIIHQVVHTRHFITPTDPELLVQDTLPDQKDQSLCSEKYDLDEILMNLIEFSIEFKIEFSIELSDTS